MGLNQEAISGGDEVHGIKSDADMSVDLANHAIKESRRMVTESENFVSRLKEAREALDLMTNAWKPQWLDWMKESKSMLEELRSWRMATTLEAKTAVRELADLRKFFLGPDHLEEMARLKEFVDVCERLERLKKNGTMDLIADTIIKLAIHE